ncbi:unnamed protein product, partial [marine sediment metagenome]
QTLYDNVDMDWLPISQLAIDVYGKPRRWAIERIDTSLEKLQRDNEAHQEKTGEDLYPGLALLEADLQAADRERDTTEEPEDFERWPMQDNLNMQDPTETPVEMWLCWDNVMHTMTKMGNRKIELDHGLMDTPRGIDPYIGEAAVPIPGRAYGDSIMNWTKGLYTQQTRLSRARADQTILNMFTQYIVREGSLGSTQWYWRPMGMATIGGTNVSPDRPITDHIYPLPKQPLPPEAFRQEAYVQAQSEAT